jgi:hypothetical protein
VTSVTGRWRITEMDMWYRAGAIQTVYHQDRRKVVTSDDTAQAPGPG